MIFNVVVSLVFHYSQGTKVQLVNSCIDILSWRPGNQVNNSPTSYFKGYRFNLTELCFN